MQITDCRLGIKKMQTESKTALSSNKWFCNQSLEIQNDNGMKAMLDDKTKGSVIQHGCHTIVFWISRDWLQNHLYTILGSSRNDDGNGNGNENVTGKNIFISVVLFRDYFNSLSFYKNGELSRNQISRSGVQVKKENEKFTVVGSRSPQYRKCCHFTLLLCRGRQRNEPKCKRHVQSDCFCSLNLLFCGVVFAVAVVVA